MDTYSAYGLRIRSQFELPELPDADAGETSPDIVFQRGDVEPVPESVDGKGGRRIRATPDRCRLSYESYGSFVVENGERVRFDPISEDVLEMKVIRRLLENEMLGVLLHQLGRLVLHASAVSVDGEVAMFLGPRGVGKSTTAAALHAAGCPIMEDDIVSVRFENGTPVVDAGVPEMRLNQDAVDALGLSETTSYQNDGKSDKRYQQFEDVPDPAPLTKCYVVEPGESLAFEPISEQEQLFSLVGNTYAQGLLSDTDQADNHFRQCSSIVQQTSFRRLTRPDDIDELPKLVESVVSDSRDRASVDGL